MKWINKAIVTVVVLGSTHAAVAEFALTNLGPNRGGGTPGADTVHGWEFIANEGMTVTHLGLFDNLGDGFDIDHDIGLFHLATNTLLASGTMSAGVGDPLIDQFRYIDTADASLTAGQRYVISYYSAIGNEDFVITDATFDVDPALTYVQGRWGGGAGGLIIPGNPTSATRIGPNFQFVTPAPSAIALLALVGLARRRRR